MNEKKASIRLLQAEGLKTEIRNTALFAMNRSNTEDFTPHELAVLQRIEARIRDVVQMVERWVRDETPE